MGFWTPWNPTGADVNSVDQDLAASRAVLQQGQSLLNPPTANPSSSGFSHFSNTPPPGYVQPQYQAPQYRAPQPQMPQAQAPQQQGNWWDQFVASQRQQTGGAFPWELPLVSQEGQTGPNQIGWVAKRPMALGSVFADMPGTTDIWNMLSPEAKAAKLAGQAVPPAAYQDFAAGQLPFAGMEAPAVAGAAAGAEPAAAEIAAQAPNWLQQARAAFASQPKLLKWLEGTLGVGGVLGAGAYGMSKINTGETPPTTPTPSGASKAPDVAPPKGWHWEADPKTGEQNLVKDPLSQDLTGGAGGGADLTGTGSSYQPGWGNNLSYEQQLALANAGRGNQQPAYSSTQQGMEQYYQEQLQLQQAAEAWQTQQQAAAAAQAQAAKYAADPYLYWAQLGSPTPEAVAALSGGKVKSGAAWGKGVPLNMPSMQWWNNLTPDEQQQIEGAFSSMGMDPATFLANMNKMQPNFASRQVSPTWAR